MLRYEITHWPENSKPQEGCTADELQSALSAIGEKEQFQVWLYEDDQPIAGLLCNQELAHHCIMALEGSDETSMAIDRAHEGKEALTEEIYLENGQLDQFSREVCIPRAEAIEGILFFLRHKRRAPHLYWTS